MTSNAFKKTALIALFLPIRKSFSYSYEPQDEEKLKPGVRVVAPFRNRDEVGVFVGFEQSDVKTKRIKFILDEEPVFPKNLVKLALWCAAYYMCGIGEMFKLIGPKESIKKRVAYSRTEKVPKKPSEKTALIIDLLAKPLSVATLAAKAGLTQKELEKTIKPLLKSGVVSKSEEFYFTASKLDPLTWEEVEVKSVQADVEFAHTSEQEAAIRKISSEIDKNSGKVTLLHGVTGSGKTEVYIALCQKALKEGGSAMVLVPEIALTYQLVKRFYSRFGRKIALMHSGLTPAQRRDEWMRLQRGDARIVIGARSAVFAPLDDLRLIVVDEEHDGSYKQNENPAYNARDVAVMLGNLASAPVVLGSATPSLESFFNTQKGKYSLSELTQRIDNRAMPPVKCIRKAADEADDRRLLPTEVVEEIMTRLGRKEQSLLFINRRGSSAFLKCNVCGMSVDCPNCSVTLTFHESGGKNIVCHYCGFRSSVPDKCPECNVGTNFRYNGVGTQKLESFIKELFPKATVGRLDHDSAPSREKAFRILEKFEKGKIDILVGTQMTAKGHDFKNLTFTSIVNADDYLSFPDFRSAERCFSLVTQAAGRTGRGDKGGEVIVTCATDHYAIRHAMAHDYKSFYKDEIEKRKATGYPPFSRLVGLMFDSTSIKKLEKAMYDLVEARPKLPATVTQLGPVPALIYKLRNRYRWKLILKGVNSKKLHEAAEIIEGTVNGGINVSIDVDPLGFY